MISHQFPKNSLPAKTAAGFRFMLGEMYAAQNRFRQIGSRLLYTQTPDHPLHLQQCQIFPFAFTALGKMIMHLPVFHTRQFSVNIGGQKIDSTTTVHGR